MRKTNTEVSTECYRGKERLECFPKEVTFEWVWLHPVNKMTFHQWYTDLILEMIKLHGLFSPIHVSMTIFISHLQKRLSTCTGADSSSSVKEPDTSSHATQRRSLPKGTLCLISKYKFIKVSQFKGSLSLIFNATLDSNKNTVFPLIIKIKHTHYRKLGE